MASTPSINPATLQLSDSFCPQTNPDEWGWGWAKYGQLANLAAWNATELFDFVLEALADLKFRPDLLNSFIRDAELQLNE